MFNWSQYINLTKNKAPRRLLVRATQYVKDKKTSLDLGAGALNDSKYLLELGFKEVIAVDIEGDSNLISDISKKYKDAFIFEKIKIEDYSFLENNFNLINAQFVLSFIKKERIVKVFDDIKKSLRNEGIFVGQFFGLKDSWSGRKNISTYSEEDVRQFLRDFEILYLEEEEKDGSTAMGVQKHWHILNFIVKK